MNKTELAKLITEIVFLNWDDIENAYYTNERNDMKDLIFEALNDVE